MVLAFVGVTASLGIVGVVHHFAGDETKAKIESGTLAVMDLVRENRATPQEVVFWLDLAADAMPLMRGRGVATTDAERATPDDNLPPGGAPRCARPLTRLRNIGYDAGYDETRRTPAWAAYRAFAPAHPAPPRPKYFETDTRTRARVDPAWYSHSGYDRGHMAPNHAVAVCRGATAQRETFLMSNIAPQIHGLNDGLWRVMEQRIISRYPARFKSVNVVCGPVYDHADHPKTIRGGVWVPDAFFLVVTDTDEDSGELRAQAYLVPHREIAESEDMSDYLTDIRTIETRTGLNFFPDLPSEKQNALETAKALKAW